ncbi:Imm8 family immunity protein [Actinokineospora fastidiosa]|uniref:Imm8 family immunity protein n=1 Tax=Actinokineospora fastidiosa TaxID=1816 RepID=UPI00166F9678|nr:Imm8 family immunity protein [Actinokineospora fastidiosa]
MHAEVKHFISPDIDLSDPTADFPDDDAVLIVALVGPKGGEGEESLQFEVMTPNALARRLEALGVVFGQGVVVVEHLRVGAVLDLIRARVERVAGLTWSDVARRLGRLGEMEGED